MLYSRDVRVGRRVMSGSGYYGTIIKVLDGAYAPVIKVLWDDEFMGRKQVGRHSPMGLMPTDQPDVEV